MPLTHYPVQVAHADYSNPAALNEPAPPGNSARELEVSVGTFAQIKRKVKGTTLRPTAIRHPGILKVALVAEKTCSQSFHNGMGGNYQDAVDRSAGLTVDHTRPFCFAPGVDNPTIAFDTVNTGDVEKVRFELFCKKDNAHPFWFTEWTATADLEKLLRHPLKVGTESFRGSLPFNDLVTLDRAATIGGDPDPAFPDGVLTVHYSPYQLKVTITTKAGTNPPFPSVAWTYIHVVADSIQFGWFPYKSDSDKNKLALFLPPARRAREMELYSDLVNTTENYNLNGQFPAVGDVKKLPLDGNRFYREERELQDNSGYEQWKAHWGDGANIPIKATVMIRNVKGRGVEAPLALGNCWLLWSYKDGATPLSQEGNALGPAGAVPACNGTIPTYLSNSQDYLTTKPADDASPSGHNCHVHRGGKRGAGGKSIFPPQPGTTNATLPLATNLTTDPQRFPFKVEAGSTRKWAARSRFRSTGELAGQTGIVFQPSRMAGDCYTLQVAVVTSDLYAEENVANEAALDAGPANLVTNSGALEVWKKVTFAQYLNGVDQLIDYEKVRLKMERNFIWLKIGFKKPALLKMADLHAAYERVRTDNTSPVPDYARAAMMTPTQISAAIVKDADGDGDYGTKNTGSGYFIPFLPYQEWKTKMIAIHGTWATAVNWSYALNHPQPDFWRARGSPYVPIADPWPTQFTRNHGVVVAGLAPTDMRVTIKPDHAAAQNALIAPNTKTVDLPFAGNLDKTATDLIGPAWTHVWNHVSYSGNDTYHPADNGSLNRDGIPRNVRILVDVSGSNVPQAKFDAIKTHLENFLQQQADGRMRLQYKTACGYQWVFAIMAEVGANLLGPNSSGFTVVSLPQNVMTNYRHPNGKAMFANAARNTACIPIMNSNDDTTYHEFLHSLFLNHPHEPANNQYRLNQDGWVSSIMKTAERNAQLCGFHMLRTRGWSFIETDANGDVPGGCYSAVGLGALPDPAGNDPTQQAWWAANCGGSVRTLHGDGARNRR